MNCCDYNCTQGRDCPARVASVGQRYPAAERLPDSKAPRLIKRAAWFMLSGIFSLLFYGYLLVALVVN